MTGRRLACSLIALALASLWGGVAAANSPPNVVLIVCDDQAWFDFGFMGNREVATPHLDRLAAQSAVFTRGYVPTSVCRPSLATIITGRYPQEHRLGIGLDGLKLPPPRVRERFEQFPSLPMSLAARDYRSLQTGKWWEGDFRDAGFTDGMTTGLPIPGSVGINADPEVGRKGLPRLDRGLLFLAGAEGLRIGREGLAPISRFLSASEDQPFFIWYAPMLPHTPHNPPQELLAKYQTSDRTPHVARYMAMCEWFDQTCGELLELLDSSGVAENTLVAFIVDNGYVPLPDVNWFDSRSKLSPYEAGVRTPILLHWPGHIAPWRDDTLVHAVDLAPTILSACGVERPDGLPGLDLLDVLAGTSAKRDTVFGATFRFKVENPTEPQDTIDYRWCVNDRWKLIVPRDPQTPAELYDVVDDPHERNDIAAARPEQMQRLCTTLDEWWTATTGGRRR